MSLVLSENQDGVLVLTINRPEQYNAFNVETIRELRYAFEKQARQSDVDAIVVTGAGKAFCAGGDVKAMQASLDGDPGRLFEELTGHLHPLIVDIRKLPKPVVGALNGAVAGGGYGLALSMDRRIAAPTVSFKPAYSRLGIVPDGGVTAFLPNIVGAGVAQRIIWGDETVKGDDALRLGLVDEIVEPQQLLPRAVEFARQLGNFPMESFRRTKELINFANWGDLEGQLDRERRRNAESARGPWLREGVAAFLEKREPEFQKREKAVGGTRGVT